MSTILEHPEAQALLDQATISADTVAACARHLTAFLRRYLPLFYRDEQRDHADTVLRGKLTSLQRKTTEPIATQAGQKRRPLQHFVGAGRWDDQAVRAGLRSDHERYVLSRAVQHGGARPERAVAAGPGGRPGAVGGVGGGRGLGGAPAQGAVAAVRAAGRGEGPSQGQGVAAAGAGQGGRRAGGAVGAAGGHQDV